MRPDLSDTAGKLVGEAAGLIMHAGYNGFSYADLSARIGIRKASIHHHFPSKVDLVVAVVEQARAIIRAQIGLLEDGAPRALDQLLAYTGYWKQCISDHTAPFCIAGMLAAELPILPQEVATAVRGHFADLGEWLEGVLALGVTQGSMRLERTPEIEAQTFMAGVYGAMLTARAFGDPQRFDCVVDGLIDRIRT